MCLTYVYAGEDQVEPKWGFKYVISFKSLHVHKRSNLSPPWTPLTPTYHQLALTVSSSDSCSNPKLTINLYTRLNCLDLLILLALDSWSRTWPSKFFLLCSLRIMNGSDWEPRQTDQQRVPIPRLPSLRMFCLSLLLLAGFSTSSGSEVNPGMNLITKWKHPLLPQP